jgi:DNA-binding LacI/PurR family transcriptional regulator
VPRARLADVAALAGVSIKTVSNVVNDHPQVRDDTRDRVRAAIGELGYRPNAVGRQLRLGRTGLIALAVPEVDVPYFAELARLVVEAAAARGLTVLVEQTGGTLEAERTLADARLAGLVDGLIISPVASSAEELEERRRAVPMVLLGEGPRPGGIDHVGLDDTAAAAEATAHLLAGGRRRVAFLGDRALGPVETSQRRQAGWHRALDAAAVPPTARPWFPVERFSFAAGHAGVSAALDDGARFDALLCASDLLALGALRALDEAGLAVPRDVAVVGWDDVAFSAYTTPPLTAVRPDVQSIAACAVGMLVERIDGEPGAGRHVVVRHHLVVRASSAGSAPAG